MVDSASPQVIEFGDPPPIKRPNTNIDRFWADVAGKALSEPMRWVSAGRHPSSQVSRIKRGTIASFRPDYDWEVVGRAVDEHGRIGVFVRYIGGDVAAAARRAELEAGA